MSNREIHVSADTYEVGDIVLVVYFGECPLDQLRSCAAIWVGGERKIWPNKLPEWAEAAYVSPFRGEVRDNNGRLLVDEHNASCRLASPCV